MYNAYFWSPSPHTSQCIVPWHPREIVQRPGECCLLMVDGWRRMTKEWRDTQTEKEDHYHLSHLINVREKHKRHGFRICVFFSEIHYNINVVESDIWIVKPRPKTQTPKAQFQPSQIQSKSVPKGLGLTLKSYGPPPTPPTPPTHNF